MENSSKYFTRNIGDYMRKIVVVFLVTALCLAITIPVNSYASSSGLGDLNAYGGSSAGSSVELEQKAETILGIIQGIGVVVSVVMLMVIGIKYMMGSIEERAEYKETLKPYLIGAFLLFSGTTVPQIIYQIAKNLI